MAEPRKKVNYKRILYEFIGFALFLFIIYKTGVNWQEHVDMKTDYKGEPATAVIYDKTASIDPYGNPHYLALLEPNLIEQTTYSLWNGQTASLTKEQFNTLAPGDLIDGFKVGQTFYVEADIKEEFNWFWITLALVSIYPVCYIIYLSFKFKNFEKLVDQFLKRHDRKITYIFGTIFYGGIIIALLFSYYSFAGTIKHAVERVASTDLIKTTAEVSHKSSGSGPEDRRYYFALSFESELGEPIHVTKEVMHNTYYHASDEVAIMYKKDNPYHVYMQKLSFKDIVFLLSSHTMLLYYLTILVTALLIYLGSLFDRKRRTGSYYR